MEELDAFKILKHALQRIANGRRKTDRLRRIPRIELTEIARKALFECGFEWAYDKVFDADE